MFASVLLLAAVALASVQAELVQMEPSVTTFSSKNWLKQERFEEDATVKAIFVMKSCPKKIAAFEATLLDRSSPKSKNYGKWLSLEEIQAMRSPDEDKVAAVLKYVESFGATARVSKLRDMIHVEVPVSKANEMLNTEFALYRSVLSPRVALPRINKPYFLPAEVAQYVSLVDDIMRFPAVRTPMQLETAGLFDDDGDSAFDSCGSKCSGYTTPEVLQQAYGYPTLTNFTTGNSMCVAEFQYQYWDQEDLDAFSSACGVAEAIEDTIGGNNPDICTNLGGCIEALLDIEYIEAVANPIPLTVWYSGTFSLLDWVNSIIEMADPPLMNSVSYGNDEVQQVSDEYMDECNTQFMTAGTMGLSLLFASGDQGVWGRSGVGTTFHPDFPAGSPYITAVGGTNFLEKSTIGEETAWDCGGGGFSDTFAMPSWQSEFVEAYLTNAAAAGILPDSSLFNATGRAYPDVSALGGQTNPYCVSYKGGSFTGVAGTSASCPVVAGVFAQLNDVRLAAGLPSLGWLNPFIYENGQCFNDVNDGSMNNCIKGTEGFATMDGWDPATGWGTPNYPCLEALMATA